jgi:beta-lactamase class A
MDAPSAQPPANKLQPKHYVRIAIVTGFSCFCLGWTFGRLGSVDAAASPREAGETQQIREGSNNPGEYRFINPLLACDVSAKKEIAEFEPLKREISSLIENKVYDKDVGNVSVYFDTRDGRWLGINTSERYFPASLMKVPSMIAVLKAAESDPDLLKKKMRYDGLTDLNAIEHFVPSEGMEPGRSYTVDELLERMIVDSDNNAVPLLIQNIGDRDFEEVLTDLGLSLPAGIGDSLIDFMDVKQYARFFRVLYNSTYLNRALSEKALSLLSRSGFPDGLRAGIPKDVAVAQKFGERSFGPEQDRSAQKELHDCGIVYYPEHPYLLCVMTKGGDYAKLAKTIQDVSRRVYSYMEKEYPR